LNEADIYLLAIKYESQLANDSIENSHNNNNLIRSLYERALDAYGKSLPELWLNYITWETKLQKFQNVSTLYWRAKKILQPPELPQFLVSYSELYQTPKEGAIN